MKKRILAMLMALCLVVGPVPAVSAMESESGIWGGNLSWSFSDGILTLTGSGEMADYDYSYDDNGDEVYSNIPWKHLQITEVIIGEGITSICDNAFSNNDSLKTISLPDTLTRIGNYAFSNCTNLKGTVNIPAGVTTINSYTFENCKNIDAVILPEALECIDYRAFAGSGLSEIAIPKTVHFIDTAAFEETHNLKRINVASNNLDYASDSQGGLYSKDMTRLYKVPGGYTGTFYIPDTVTSLGDAFNDCIFMKELFISKNVTDDLFNQFYGCASLQNFIVDPSNPKYYTIDGILYGKIERYDRETDSYMPYRTLISCPPAMELGKYVICDDTEVLQLYSFYNCTRLSEISIPATCICEDIIFTFEGCENLTSVWFEENHPQYISNIDGVVFNQNTTLVEFDPITGEPYTRYYPAKAILYFFPNGRTGYYEIPDGVEVIEGGSFTAAKIEALRYPESIRCVYSAAKSLEWLLFTGNKPDVLYYCMDDVTATVFYPDWDASWLAYDKFEPDIYVGPVFNYAGGNLEYVPYSKEVIPEFNPTNKNPFTDVPADSFCYEPVLWAVENDITTGTSATTFNPGGECLRAQVVTFLWRAAGCPAPTTTFNPFVDVEPTDFCYDAVLWAVEKGITTGADASHFNPRGICNRAQVVTFLYRAFGEPAMEHADNPFADVPAGAWYAAPVLWAVEHEVTNGVSATAFAPETNCNRAQIVTFLYRAYN